jgi:hypothetical protein
MSLVITRGSFPDDDSDDDELVPNAPGSQITLITGDIEHLRTLLSECKRLKENNSQKLGPGSSKSWEWLETYRRYLRGRNDGSMPECEPITYVSIKQILMSHASLLFTP